MEDEYFQLLQNSAFTRRAVPQTIAAGRSCVTSGRKYINKVEDISITVYGIL
jgi:hypothetical protein